VPGGDQTRNRKSAKLRRAEKTIEFEKLSDRKKSCIVSIKVAPKKPNKKPCPDCGTEILAESTRCSHCAQFARNQPTKTTWPELGSLIEEIKSTSYVAVAARLGVTDNTVRKHLKARGIDYKTVKGSIKSWTHLVEPRTTMKRGTGSAGNRTDDQDIC